MPELSSLTRQKPTDVTIDLGDGDTVTLTFDRNRVTPAWVQGAAQRDEQQDALSLPKALAEVIVSWDVTNDGQPFPPTVENLAELSYPAQKALLEQLMGAAVPGEAEGKALPATSPAVSEGSTNETMTFQNGTASSTSPTASASPSPT